MAEKQRPGEGVMGWLGRQVGYVKKAVKTKPQPAPKPTAAPQRPADAGADAPSASAPHPAPTDSPKVLYREDSVEVADHPTRPGVKLRRTVIDEVIVEEKGAEPP